MAGRREQNIMINNPNNNNNLGSAFPVNGASAVLDRCQQMALCVTCARVTVAKYDLPPTRRSYRDGTGHARSTRYQQPRSRAVIDQPSAGARLWRISRRVRVLQNHFRNTHDVSEYYFVTFAISPCARACTSVVSGFKYVLSTQSVCVCVLYYRGYSGSVSACVVFPKKV